MPPAHGVDALVKNDYLALIRFVFVDEKDMSTLAFNMIIMVIIHLFVKNATKDTI